MPDAVLWGKRGNMDSNPKIRIQTSLATPGPPDTVNLFNIMSQNWAAFPAGTNTLLTGENAL
jgi:hypothetical protein